MGYLDDKFTIPPVQEEVVQNTENPPVVEGSVQPATTVETPVTQTPTEVTPSEPPKVDEFIENFNKKFSSSFKTEDDVRNILGMPQKIGELEGKAKLAEDYAKRIEDYERQLEEYKNNGNSEFLSKPLIRQAFVAQQLIEKYPDKDPYALQEIVMADVDKLGDLDVLVKNQKISHPKLAETDIKAVLFKKYGIDPEVNPTDWDSITKAEIAMDADSARSNIKALTSGIEFPKMATKEERLAAESKAITERQRAVEPLKAEFTAFDKFKIGDFEYESPADFKSKLPDMFEAMFVDAGLDPTKENLQTAKEMRDGMFLLQNFEKIKEVIAKQAQTDIQKKLDEVLSNNKLPNTNVASDEGEPEKKLPGPGLSIPNRY